MFDKIKINYNLYVVTNLLEKHNIIYAREDDNIFIFDYEDYDEVTAILDGANIDYEYLGEYVETE